MKKKYPKVIIISANNIDLVCDKIEQINNKPKVKKYNLFFVLRYRKKLMQKLLNAKYENLIELEKGPDNRILSAKPPDM